jgi:hypothetical protein
MWITTTELNKNYIYFRKTFLEKIKEFFKYRNQELYTLHYKFKSIDYDKIENEIMLLTNELKNTSTLDYPVILIKKNKYKFNKKYHNIAILYSCLLHMDTDAYFTYEDKKTIVKNIPFSKEKRYTFIILHVFIFICLLFILLSCKTNSLKLTFLLFAIFIYYIFRKLQ